MSTFYTGTAFLHWDMNTEIDLAGYMVYLGDVSRTYNRVTTSFGLTTTTAQPGATITRIANGIPQYLTVTAYDTAGNESTYGNEDVITKDVPLLHVLRQVK